MGRYRIEGQQEAPRFTEWPDRLETVPTHTGHTETAYTHASASPQHASALAAWISTLTPEQIRRYITREGIEAILKEMAERGDAAAKLALALCGSSSE